MAKTPKVEVICGARWAERASVTGYRHSCRRCKAAGVEDSVQLATDASPRSARFAACKCVHSRCRAAFGPRPAPHTATLILAPEGRSGGTEDLGHSDPNITAKVYAHLVRVSFETAVNRLPSARRAKPTPAPGAHAAQRFVSPWSATRVEAPKGKGPAPRKSSEGRPLIWLRGQRLTCDLRVMRAISPNRQTGVATMCQSFRVVRRAGSPRESTSGSASPL